MAGEPDGPREEKGFGSCSGWLGNSRPIQTSNSTVIIISDGKCSTDKLQSVAAAALKECSAEENSSRLLSIERAGELIPVQTRLATGRFTMCV